MITRCVVFEGFSQPEVELILLGVMGHLLKGLWREHDCGSFSVLGEDSGASGVCKLARVSLRVAGDLACAGVVVYLRRGIG